VAEAYALMHARVQRLVDMGHFRGSVDVAAVFDRVWIDDNADS